MTVVGKDGQLVTTSVLPLVTTKRIAQTTNATNTSGISTVRSGPMILDDQDEFAENQKWDKVRSLVHVLYDLNISMAIVQSLIGLVLFLTIIDRNLRQKSQMWYMYHMTAVSVFTGLVLHATTHAGLVIENRQFCFFVMYCAEYAFFGTSMNVLLINAEIYFTKVLTLPRWESNQFFRFLVSILTGWLVVCLLVAHVIINNNDGRREFYCLYINDATVKTVRVVLRSLIPAILCFFFVILLIVTYICKRSRISFVTMSGQLKEVRTDGSGEEPQWVRCAVFLNSVFIVRTVAMTVVHFNSVINGPEHYTWLVFMIMIHVQSMYTMPFCLFFIDDVRLALKKVVLATVQKLSLGKLRFGDDLENLSVSFGNINATCN